MTPQRFWFWHLPVVRFGQWRQRVWLARRAIADRRAEWWARWTQRRLP